MVLLPPQWLLVTAMVCVLPWLLGLPCAWFRPPGSAAQLSLRTGSCVGVASQGQQLFLVPWGGQDRDSRGSILMALFFISGKGEGEARGRWCDLGNHPPTSALCSHALPIVLQELNLAFSAWTYAAASVPRSRVLESQPLQPRPLSLMAT